MMCKLLISFWCTCEIKIVLSRACKKNMIRRVYRYSLFGSLRVWLTNNERQEEIKELLHDALLLLVTIPTLFLLTYMAYYIIDYIYDPQTPVNFKYTSYNVKLKLHFKTSNTLMAYDNVYILIKFIISHPRLSIRSYNIFPEIIRYE